jgi:hypothetical protein
MGPFPHDYSQDRLNSRAATLFWEVARGADLEAAWQSLQSLARQQHTRRGTDAGI